MFRYTDEDRARLITDELLPKPGISDIAQRIARENSPLYQHCCNVAFISAQMALKLNMSESEIQDIVCGALIHDCGKLFIPRYILDKVEPLTKMEMQTIREHAKLGYDYVCAQEAISHNGILTEMEREKGKVIIPFTFSDVVKSIVLNHHENEIGTGYPNGIKKMTLAEKIVSIADKFDAISFKRPYHSDFRSRYEILEEMDTFKDSFSDSEELFKKLYECNGL